MALTACLGGWAGEIEPPRLSLSTTDPQADVLTWQDTGESYYLEEVADLQGQVVWMPLLDTGQTTEGLWRIAVPRQPGIRFYQLRRDPELGELLLDHAVNLAADLPLQNRPGDACPDLPFLDRFNPVRWSPLVGVPRTLEGGFVLVPGLWEGVFESFCLKTGTPAPAAGDGYVPALMNGPRADIIAKILQAVSLNPDIEQETAQILLWSIVLRTPLTTLPPSLQTLAGQWLTTSDLNRLMEASTLKARRDEAYTRRFVLALRKPFEELPPGIRDLLHWDDLVEQALARAEVLTYEEIQNLAFAATAPPLPPEPGREIVYGRWAWMPSTVAPPGGFCFRHLVGYYTETVVQVCVPEPITIERDAQGRITRLADLEGRELRTTYSDTVPPLDLASEQGAKGYAFGVIEALGPPDPDDPRRLLTASHAGIGWVLTGPVTGGGTAQNQGRFRDAVTRYAWTISEKTELQRLDAELTRVHPGRTPAPATSVDRLLDLAGYCEGLRLAFADIPEEDPEFPHLSERLNLAYRAWIAEFAAFASGQAGPRTLAGAGAAPMVAGRPRNRPALAAGGPRPEPDILDRTIFRLFDWMFGTRQYQAKPANSDRQNIGLTSRITSGLRDWWNQNFAGHKKHSTVVATGFKFAGMPSFLAIPQKMIERLIAMNVELYHHAGDVIANAGGDPPHRLARAQAGPASDPLAREDFDVPTVAQVWNPGPLQAGPGITAQRLAQAQVLQDRLLELAAHLYAAVTAIHRQAGASRAGNAQWYSRQGAYSLHYLRRAGVLMLDTADAIEAWIQVLVDEGVEDPWISREDLDAVIHRLRTEGYTTEERAMLAHLGLRDPEIAACLAAAVDAAIEPDGVPAWGSLGDYARTLRELGIVLMQMPEAFPLRP